MNDVYIGPIQHDNGLCRGSRETGVTDCTCWCLPCERHNFKPPAPVALEPSDYPERFVHGGRHGRDESREDCAECWAEARRA